MGNAFRTPEWNGYGVTNDATQPAVAEGRGGPSLKNVFQSVMKFGAPEAYERGRQDKLKGQLGEALKSGDYGNAGNLLIDLGQYDAGMQMRDQQAQMAKQGQSEKLRMAYQMTQELADPNMSALDRFQKATVMSQRLGLPAPTDPAEFTNEAVQSALDEMRIKGGFQEEAGEGFSLSQGQARYDANGNLVAENAKPVEAATRKTIQGADGYQYYMDTGERVLPGVNKPAPAPTDPWKVIATGDGNSIMYNSQTGERQEFRGETAPPSSGSFSFDGVDDFTSPFESSEFRAYNGGGKFTLTSLERGDEGGKFGDEGLAPNFVTGGAGEPTNRKPTEYDKVRDREMAKDLTEWTLGGQVQAASQLRRLKDVIGRLEGDENVSGPVIGNLPFKTITAAKAKDVEDTVGSVVQLSLKAILGGQFAQQEADQLLRRAYDPALDEAVNAKRLKVLYDDLVYRSKMNDYAARYADQHGTLEGFDGYLPQIGDFFATAKGSPSAPQEMSDDDLLKDLGLN